MAEVGAGGRVWRRVPIVARLLAAFLAVSLLPIGILAYLSYRESGEPTAAHVEERAGTAEERAGERIGGVSIAAIELGVAGTSLALAVLMAVWIARTIVRPLRDLGRAMERVEDGDLGTRAEVRSNDEIAQLAASFNRMVTGLEREALVRNLFGQYVTPELARAAIEQRGRLEGQVVQCTALFSDIRNFTGISEALPAATVIAMLNRYFERMAAVVVDHGGLVNKFGGDSLLAVFGTPLNAHDDHATRAVRAGLALRDALDDFNREQVEMRLPEIMIGIGIGTGEVVAGNVGGAERIEYTVIGDAVNVASRLQEMTKEWNTALLVSGETARAADGAARFERIGACEVRGKAGAVEVFGAEPLATGV